MGKFQDLTGQTFGYWTVLGHERNEKNQIVWRCRCRCGTERLVLGGNLSTGASVSCGCYKSEKAHERYDDLSGKKFGKLTAIRRSDSTGKIKWICECECGSIIEVPPGHLKSGHTKSCGCYRNNCKKKETPKKKRITPNLEGQVFGHLTVLSKHITERGTYNGWDAQCVCGKIIQVNSCKLIKGDRKSCGCKKYEGTAERGRKSAKNLVGQQFGELTVLYDSGKRKGKNIKWHCRCSCGRETDVPGGALQNGNTKSCGHCNINSFGESKVLEFLDANYVEYLHDTNILDCRFPDTNALARFDFYVNNEYVIEWDGIQHFDDRRGNWNSGESTETIQSRDAFKNQFCFDHNIPIIRIPYTHYNDLCFEDLVPETSPFLLSPEGVNTNN